MAEFCVKCSEKEAEIELLRNELFKVKQELKKLQSDNDSLSLDLAFYEGRITNLSCNNK